MVRKHILTIDVNSVIFRLNGKIKGVYKHLLFFQINPHARSFLCGSMWTSRRLPYAGHPEATRIWENYSDLSLSILVWLMA